MFEVNKNNAGEERSSKVAYFIQAWNGTKTTEKDARNCETKLLQTVNIQIDSQKFPYFNQPNTLTWWSFKWLAIFSLTFLTFQENNVLLVYGSIWFNQILRIKLETNWTVYQNEEDRTKKKNAMLFWSILNIFFNSLRLVISHSYGRGKKIWRAPTFFQNNIRMLMHPTLSWEDLEPQLRYVRPLQRFLHGT